MSNLWRVAKVCISGGCLCVTLTRSSQRERHFLLSFRLLMAPRTKHCIMTAFLWRFRSSYDVRNAKRLQNDKFPACLFAVLITIIWRVLYRIRHVFQKYNTRTYLKFWALITSLMHCTKNSYYKMTLHSTCTPSHRKKDKISIGIFSHL